MTCTEVSEHQQQTFLGIDQETGDGTGPLGSRESCAVVMKLVRDTGADEKLLALFDYTSITEEVVKENARTFEEFNVMYDIPDLFY
jgi:hypothetical protein